MTDRNANEFGIHEASCARCEKHATTSAEVDDLFGTMNRQGVITSQPWCKACRAVNRRTPANEVAESLTFGVEIEYTNSVPRYRVAREIKQSLDAGGAYTRHLYGAEFEIHTVNGWTTLKVVYDGSVSNGGEVVMPPLTLAEMDILQTTVRAMRRAGCQSNPHQAGIHVHIGTQDLDAKQIKNVVRYGHRWEDHIKACANTNPSRTRWCRDMVTDFVAAVEAKRDATREKIREEWYDKMPGSAYGARHHYHASRYTGINLHSLFWDGGHKTIEFRYFNGTLHAGKIRAYVTMCVYLVARAAAASQASSKRKSFNRPKDVKKFLKWIEIPTEGNKAVFFHLENNARAAAGLPLNSWN